MGHIRGLRSRQRRCSSSRAARWWGPRPWGQWESCEPHVDGRYYGDSHVCREVSWRFDLCCLYVWECFGHGDCDGGSFDDCGGRGSGYFAGRQYDDSYSDDYRDFAGGRADGTVNFLDGATVIGSGTVGTNSTASYAALLNGPGRTVFQRCTWVIRIMRARRVLRRR